MSGSSNACHLTRHNIDFVSMSSLFRVTSPMLGWSRNGHLQPCIRVFQLQLNNTQKPGCRYVQTLARASLNPHNVSDQSSRCISSQSRSGLGSGGFFKSRLLLKPSHQNVLPTRLQLLLQARSLSTVSGSLLLYRKSTFNDTLRSNLVLQFIRTFGRTRPRLNPQDPPTEHPLVAHSLDFRTLRWTLPRGLRLSLPILALYLLFYLVLLIPEDSSWRQRALSVAVQYGTYRKHECFQRLNSPITYLTSQFFHDNPKTLIVDSIALIGIATVLGPSIGAKTFFILYLLGGFIGPTLIALGNGWETPCGGSLALNTMRKYERASSWCWRNNPNKRRAVPKGSGIFFKNYSTTSKNEENTLKFFGRRERSKPNSSTKSRPEFEGCQTSQIRLYLVIVPRDY